MACELLMQCDLISGFLKCALPKDTIDVDLKVQTLKGIHTFREDYKMQMTKCSPWRTIVQPYPSLKKKMMEFMRHWQIITPPICQQTSPTKTHSSSKETQPGTTYQT